MSLNNFGGRLFKLGRSKETLKTLHEAIVIHRRLTEANPQEFISGLAMSLNNLGLLLSDLGWQEEALKPSQEAAEIYRRLAGANPQAFLPYLATSLGTYGSILRSLDRHAEAAQAFGEGLEHIVPFYRKMPQASGGLAGLLLRDYLKLARTRGRSRILS
jgi:tetratricopeptide (TPR) repeat protein